MRRVILISLLSLTVALTRAQEINTARIDSFINHIEQQGQSMGAVSITQAGKNVYRRRFGTMRLPGEASRTADKYRIGSITKLFTATIAHRLFEEGRLRPEETLDNYFPDIPNAGKITIAHLLNHTSGLGNYVLNEGNPSSWVTVPLSHEEDIMPIIKKQGVLFRAGEDVKYSNSGYYLLARILERVCGKQYPQIVQEWILTPLGMKNTLSGIAEKPDICLSYYQDWDDEWKVWPDFYFPNVIGVGDMASTTDDVNLFLQALFAGKLVSQNSLRMMIPVEKQAYGQGIMKIECMGKTLYGHSGETFGTRSLAVYDTDRGVAVTLSVNGSVKKLSVAFDEVLAGIMSGVYDKPLTLP